MILFIFFPPTFPLTPSSLHKGTVAVEDVVEIRVLTERGWFGFSRPWVYEFIWKGSTRVACASMSWLMTMRVKPKELLGVKYEMLFQLSRSKPQTLHPPWNEKRFSWMLCDIYQQYARGYWFYTPTGLYFTRTISAYIFLNQSSFRILKTGRKEAP